MKPIILVVLLIAVVAGYLVYSSSNKTTAPVATAQPKNADPLWMQDISEGTELVPDGQAKLHVRGVRRNEKNRSFLDFHISEEHGYMVDGIRVEFWFRFKDEDSGEWIEDTKRIDYFVRERLQPNETLVASTILRDMDYRDQGIDLPSTVDEDWGVAIKDYMRAMRKVE